MSDEEEYEYGMLDDGFTGVYEEEDLSFLDQQKNMAFSQGNDNLVTNKDLRLTDK